MLSECDTVRDGAICAADVCQYNPTLPTTGRLLVGMPLFCEG
jgi:hypothetical protein